MLEPSFSTPPIPETAPSSVTVTPVSGATDRVRCSVTGAAIVMGAAMLTAGRFKSSACTAGAA
ncbi:MAG: hypothetical protein BWX70_03036 [Verrucomicrobia bacterium ADurb.Bin070]|nr:MAG: hypothetical protein BWX70_03036 [Verrucomicrobia bacterium ADurb.Bin070]